MSVSKACSTCVGYGIWAFGTPIPMGPLDAEDGMPTKPCEECGASANPLSMQESAVPEGYNEVVPFLSIFGAQKPPTHEQVEEWEQRQRTLTLVFTDWNPKWREEFLIFDEQQALFELEEAGLPHYPVRRERHLSFKLEHPLTKEERAWLEESKKSGLFLDYFTGDVDVEEEAEQPTGYTPEQIERMNDLSNPVDGEVLASIYERLREHYPENVHPLETGLYDAWLGAVGVNEVPESWKLPEEMRGKGIANNSKLIKKRGRHKKL